MKKSLFVVLFTLAAFTAPVLAIEKLTLTTPESEPSVSDWYPRSIYLDRDAPIVTVVFANGTTGKTKSCSATATTTPTAIQLISTLNTANLTSNSLHKRAMTWGQGQPNCLGVGTISGTPD